MRRPNNYKSFYLNELIIFALICAPIAVGLAAIKDNIMFAPKTLEYMENYENTPNFKTY